MRVINRVLPMVLASVGAFATAAYASDAASDVEPEVSMTETSGLEEIVVTARRRNEKEQQTPISITALTAADLRQESISNFQQLTGQTPSLVMEKSPYDPFGAEVGIRGQVATDIVLTQAPPIGIYVDDVYDATSIALNLLNFDDVQQVETLKGPQGTLYGRNTTGGAVKVTTPLPDYSGVNGQATVGYGNYHDEHMSAAVNLPLVDRRLALRLSGGFENRDGFGHVIGTNTPLEDWQSESFRATLRFDASDNLQIIGRGWYSHAVSNRQNTNLVYVAAGPTAANLAVAAQTGQLSATDGAILAGAITPATPGFPALYAQLLNDINSGYKALSVYINSPYSHNGYAINEAIAGAFGLNGIQTNKAGAKIAGGSITANYQFGPNLYVKSISATQLTQRLSDTNTGGAPFLLLAGTVADSNPRQYSQELQIGGDSFNDTLRWVAGYYYFDLRGDDNAAPLAEVVPLGPSPSYGLNNVSDISNSFFGQGTYSITPSVHFTGGLRYTSERTQTIDTSSNVFFGAAGPATVCANSNLGVVPPCFGAFPNRYHNWSYTAGFDWQVTEDVLLYAKTSRGFRAGGANERGTNVSFAPEIVTDYEVGAKSEWFDHRFRANLAIYRSQYDDIQRSLNGVAPSGQITTNILNAAKARISGVELELNLAPVKGLTLSVNGAFTNAGYQTYTNIYAPPGQQDYAGNSFPYVPRWQLGSSATYAFEDGAGKLTSTIDYTYQSKVNFQPDATGKDPITGASLAPYASQGGMGLFNARISQAFKSSGWSFSIWGRNLADKQYITHASDTVSAGLGIIIAGSGDPRTFGAEISKRF